MSAISSGRSAFPTLLPFLLTCAVTLPVGVSAQVTDGSRPNGPWALTTDDGMATRALFTARSGGEECLWTTDGTSADTRRLSPAGRCLDPSFLTVDDGIAYFHVREPESRWSVWRTDGTAAGTWALKASPGPSPNRGLSMVAATSLDKVFFLASTPEHGSEPWVSDGDPDDARLLADLAPGPDSSVLGGFRELGSWVLFYRFDTDGAAELWRTDGTAPGTTRIATLMGSGPFAPPAGPLEPTRLFPAGDGAVFFLLGEGCRGELWSTNGTADGTALVRRFTGESCPTGYADPATLHDCPEDLFFVADDGTGGDELWRTDGSPAGTFPVTDFENGQPFRVQEPHGWRPAGLGDRIYFAADGGSETPGAGYELWSTTGDPGSEELVVDLCPGLSDGYQVCDSAPEEIRDVGDRLVIRDRFETLWISDGTDEGTKPVICPSGCVTDIGSPASLDGAILFEHWGFDRGYFLVRADLPGGSARELRLFRTLPDAFAILGSRAVFFADDGRHGLEPWVTDGTSQGTRLLVDVETSLVPEALAPPADLSVVKLGRNRVRLVWKDVTDGEAGFSVQRMDPGSRGFEWEGSVPANTTHYDTTLEGSGRTGFRVWSWRPGTTGTVFSWMVETSVVVGGLCEPDDTHLCLQDGRFRVSVRWRNHHAPPGAPETGVGRVFPAGSETDDSGFFWFFSPKNLELAVKMLDGSPLNEHFWLFHGGLSDLEYWIDVEETVDAGPGPTRTYHSPPGRVCGGIDKTAFPAGSFAALDGAIGIPDEPTLPSSTTEPGGSCVPDSETLCLLDGRIAVRASWSDDRGSGVGHAAPHNEVTGFFWFFRPGNVELIVKAIDGRPVNGKLWIFYGALSDLGYTLEVTDLVKGETRTYENPPHTICGQGDTRAF